MIPVFTTWLFNKKLKEQEMSFEEVVRFAVEKLDACAIEIPASTFPDWSDASVRDLKLLLHDSGLFCASIAAINHFNVDAEHQKEEIDLTRRFIDIASYMGSWVLNVFFAGWGDPDEAAGRRDIMIESMRRVVAYAEEKGVILALEAHGPFTTTVQDNLDILRDCPSKYLRLNLDTGNLRDGPQGNIRLAEHTAHVHIKPTYRDYDDETHDAEMETVIRGLKAAGYNGTVALEKIEGDPITDLPGLFAEFSELVRG